MANITGRQFLAPVGYGESLAAYLEKIAGEKDKFGSLAAKTGTRCLRATATYVRGLEAMQGAQSESLILAGLYQAQQRHSGGNAFKPGRRQNNLLAALEGQNHPEPDRILAELLCLGVVDATEALASRQEAMNQEQQRVAQQAQIVPQLEDAVASTAAELDHVKAVLADAQFELDAARDELAYWRGEAETAGIERPNLDGDTITVETSGGPVELHGRHRTPHPTEKNVYLRWAPKAQAVEWFTYSKKANPNYTRVPSEEDATALRDRWVEEGIIGQPKPEQDTPTDRAPSGNRSGSAGSLEEILR